MTTVWNSLRSVLAVGLLLVCAGGAAMAEPAQFVGSYLWRTTDHKLGGFSGIEVSRDGRKFVAISDRGGVISGQFKRQGAEISTIEISERNRLKTRKGQPLEGWQTDAEGLAIHPNGRVFVSFERVHRVAAYTPWGRATALPRPKAFKALQVNSGFEALAINAQGHLFALPERSGQLQRPFPVWRFAGGKWSQPFGLRRAGGFLPVGADFGPDGKFYLLEREFTGLGFRTRIRRFALGKTGATGEETILETGTWRHDNLEGLSVWKDRSGAIRLTMISDNNFRSFQTTQIVEYRIPAN